MTVTKIKHYKKDLYTFCATKLALKKILEFYFRSVTEMNMFMQVLKTSRYKWLAAQSLFSVQDLGI